MYIYVYTCIHMYTYIRRVKQFQNFSEKMVINYIEFKDPAHEAAGMNESRHEYEYVKLHT